MAARGHLRVRGNKAPKVRQGLTIARTFSRRGVDPATEVGWELRTATIRGKAGEIVFEQEAVEVPKLWSPLATNVIAFKYFHGPLGSPHRERSVRQVVRRVARTITAWGTADGRFATEDDADAFEAELSHLAYTQKMSFNSPIWFNVGVAEKPQCSACFINAVDDDMGSILRLTHTEGMLFKHGSGTGSNLSRIRSSKEFLSGGGRPSGPVSFMRGFDALAGAIRSGGNTGRAAKMVILDADHPDIVEFVTCKADEERKASALIAAGYDAGFGVKGGAYDSVSFQNANHSVRVSDAFMRAVVADGEWPLRARTDGRTTGTIRALELMRLIAEAAWRCGDPGMQFDTTVNAWHTCPNTARINASNACAEYMFLDDSACNLAALNLARFRLSDGSLDVEGFRSAVRLTVLAQDIVVSHASYPTDAIARNSEAYRPLGLGYTNLGALLMGAGLPYDSERARAWAAAITAVMTGEAYAMSARMAARAGPFEGFERNREPFLGVLRKHAERAHAADPALLPPALFSAVGAVWADAQRLAARHGVRNGQVTALAPTGTTSFLMDCDTTGIEPAHALVGYKTLAGGGVLEMVNNAVPLALERLGYSPDESTAILRYVRARGTIEGAPHLRPEHLAIFDCALKPATGRRAIHYMGHVRMMGAVQPFLSGGISKTVNMARDATVLDVEHVFVESWRAGVKAVSVYRDGCKETQPLSSRKAAPDEAPPR